MLGMGSVDSVRRLRAEIKKEGKAPNPKPAGPRPKHPTGAEYVSRPEVASWTVPFPGGEERTILHLIKVTFLLFSVISSDKLPCVSPRKRVWLVQYCPVSCRA